MKIYTKNGDLGETSLLGGQRVPKDALRIEAYGTVDELNSALGIARAHKPSADVDQILGLIQSDLFILGADLAASGEKRSAMIQPVGHEHVARLEQTIDALDAQLPPLTTFILPGGSPLAAQLHLARTICRRAERLVVRPYLSRRQDRQRVQVRVSLSNLTQRPIDSFPDEVAFIR